MAYFLIELFNLGLFYELELHFQLLALKLQAMVISSFVDELCSFCLWVPWVLIAINFLEKVWDLREKKVQDMHLNFFVNELSKCQPYSLVLLRVEYGLGEILWVEFCFSIDLIEQANTNIATWPSPLIFCILPHLKVWLVDCGNLTKHHLHNQIQRTN